MVKKVSDYAGIFPSFCEPALLFFDDYKLQIVAIIFLS